MPATGTTAFEKYRTTFEFNLLNYRRCERRHLVEVSFSFSPLIRRLCVLGFDSIMASTIPLHFKFKLWSNPHPNTHLDVIAVRKRINRRSPTASFYSTQQHHLLHRIFNPKSKYIHTVLTRVSSDGGGIVDAASQQSASEVSSELFCLFMFLPYR